MKKLIIFYALLTSVFAFNQAVMAQKATDAPTPEVQNTPSPTPENKLKLIEDLKNRIATKVAELRQNEKRAIFGVVKSASLSTITLESGSKEIKAEVGDEITVVQFLRGVRTKLTLDDVSKNDVVTLFGDYDQTLDLLKAKVVFIESTPPVKVNGVIRSIDLKEFTLSVATGDNKTYTIDVEKDTKTFLWEPAGGIVKSGFSKLTVGETVHILGIPVPKKENRIHAFRIVDIGTVGPGGITAPVGAVTPTPRPSPLTTIKPTTKPTPTESPSSDAP